MYLPSCMNNVCMLACVCVFTCMPRTSARVCVCVGISGVKRAGLGAVRADGAAESRGQFRTPQYATSTGDCRFVLFLRMRTCDSQSIIGHARVPVSAASCPDPSPLCCLSHGVFLIQVRTHTHTRLRIAWSRGAEIEFGVCMCTNLFVCMSQN